MIAKKRVHLDVTAFSERLEKVSSLDFNIWARSVLDQALNQLEKLNKEEF